ncbi:MAG TPA: IS21 family transposase [Erysipelotrichaceae bacterium]|nr:IS21 family transposase [Erysipelotrichaceae bacterium]
MHTRKEFFMYCSKEVLRLISLGMSQRQISSQLNISRNSVSKIYQAAVALNLDWTQVACLDEGKVSSMLFPSQENASKIMQPRPDYDYVYEELKKKGVTLKLLWREYVAECHAANSIPLQYSQFCRCYREHHAVSKATMHFTHKPGVRIEVDWAGTTIPIYDLQLGEVFKAYLFVATLPFSQYSYAEALSDMKQMSWISAHTKMYEFFGGVTQMLYVDNLKTGVIKHPKNEDPVLNQSYKEMAEYYNTAIVPAKPRTPKAKPSVEGTVGKVTTHIIARLRNQKFSSIKLLNEAIKECLDEFNTQPFQKKDSCRKEVYFDEELPFMLPLPFKPFEYSNWKTVTLPYNYHIAHEFNYYSVPYEFIQHSLDVRITKSLIEVFYKGHRVCTHQRLYGKKGQYSTKQDHMPPNHQKSNEWNGESLRKQAKSIGEKTYQVIDRLLLSYKVEQQGYNGCRSILKLADDYSNEVLEQACAKALSLISIPRYKNIKLIITHGQGTLSEKTDQISNDNTHAFVRGASYYGGKHK